MKGYVYIMTTAVDGIVKIGKTKDWNRRCQEELERNGYRNMNGLKIYFVVETSNCDEIENIMHDIFRESRVIGSDGSKTEMFALNKERAKRVLDKMGTVVFPTNNKVKNTTNTKSVGPRFTFKLIDIPIGSKLTFIRKTELEIITADEDTGVLCDGEKMTLSAVVDKYYKSGTCPADNFKYNGAKLTKIRKEKGV